MEPTHITKRQPEARLVLTVTETADALGISRALAYELVRRGELPSIRLGRRIVVPKVQLHRLVLPDDAEGDAPSSGATEVGFAAASPGPRH